MVKKRAVVRMAEDERSEEGQFWLAKIKDNPERLKKSITFAGQVFKVGWVVAKARYYSFLSERGCTQVCRLLLAENTYP